MQGCIRALFITVAIALTLPAATAQARATIGIADQKADLFSDERFLSLEIPAARRAVPWDALRYDFTREDVDAWLAGAKAQGIEPLITFSRSRVRPHTRPTPAQFRAAFVGFRKRYPWVRQFATWNEPNLEDARRARLIARYFMVIRDTCRGCVVLGGDLLDRRNLVPWTKQFLRSVRGARPRYWGLHNYVSANRFSTRDTLALLRATKGSTLWLTETGGLVARRNDSDLKLREGPEHAAQVTRFILRRFGRMPRIKRIYLYHWNSSSPTDTWDSAFIGPDGGERPALGVLRGYLGAR